MVIGSDTGAVADTSPRAAATKDLADRTAGHAAAHGGIDGESLRQRLIHGKIPGNTLAENRSSGNALRVTEKESARTQHLPRPQATHDWDLRLTGTLSTRPVTPTIVAPSQEDAGAILLARELDLRGNQRAITTTGRIGDGPHGSQGTNKGDYDFYEFRAANGDPLTVDIDRDDALTPQACLYDAKGDLQIGPWTSRPATSTCPGASH
jgi:hypothetical protein